MAMAVGMCSTGGWAFAQQQRSRSLRATNRRQILHRCTSNDDAAAASSQNSQSSSASSARERRRQLRTELVRKAFREMTKSMEEVDYPLWMDDEGDPNWGDDEPDDGWGFDISKFFEKPDKAKVMKNKASSAEKTAGSDSDYEDVEDEEWDRDDAFQWMVWEICQEEWQEVIWEDKRPILVLVFERYGPSSKACWDTLKELEKAVKTFYDKKKIALRAAKLDAQRDQDMAAALKVESFPALLVIRESKLLHRIYGTRTEDEILQATAHFFHGARRPAFLGAGLTTVEAVPEGKSKPKPKLKPKENDKEK